MAFTKSRRCDGSLVGLEAPLNFSGGLLELNENFVAGKDGGASYTRKACLQYRSVMKEWKSSSLLLVARDMEVTSGTNEPIASRKGRSREVTSSSKVGIKSSTDESEPGKSYRAEENNWRAIVSDAFHSSPSKPRTFEAFAAQSQIATTTSSNELVATPGMELKKNLLKKSVTRDRYDEGHSYETRAAGHRQDAHSHPSTSYSQMITSSTSLTSSIQSTQHLDSPILFLEEHHSPVTSDDPQSMNREGQNRLASSSVLLTRLSSSASDKGILDRKSLSSSSSSASSSSLQMTLPSAGPSIPVPAVSPRLTGKRFVDKFDASIESNKNLMFRLCSPMAHGRFRFSVVSVEATGTEGVDRLRTVPMGCLQRARKLRIRPDDTLRSSRDTRGRPSTDRGSSQKAITTDGWVVASTSPASGAALEDETTKSPPNSKDEMQSSANQNLSSETSARIYSGGSGGKMDTRIRTGGSELQKGPGNERLHSAMGNKFPANPIIGSITAWIKGYARVRCADEKIPETASPGDLRQPDSGGNDESIPNKRGSSTLRGAGDGHPSTNCSRLPGIKYLDLSGCSVRASDIQILAGFMAGLKHLDLSNYGFSSSDDSGGGHTNRSFRSNESTCKESKSNFKVFDLSRNSIKFWPSELLRAAPFCFVLKLNLSHNAIRSLPPRGVEELPRLKHLDLSHNHLEYLDAGAFTSEQLSHVDLSWNRLKVLGSMSFFYLPNLVELKLTSNSIESIGRMALYKVCRSGRSDVGVNKNNWKRKKVKISLDNNRLPLDSILKWRVPFLGHRERSDCSILIHLRNNSMKSLLGADVEKHFQDLLGVGKPSMFRKICKSWTNLRLDLSRNDFTCECSLAKQMVLLRRVLAKSSCHGREKGRDLDSMLPGWKKYSCNRAPPDKETELKEKISTGLMEFFMNSDCLEKLCPLQECTCTWKDFQLEMLNCSGRRDIFGSARSRRAQPGDFKFVLPPSKFHSSLLETVRTIDLSNNRISTLDSLNFLEKCTHLENLYLHSNFLGSIPDLLVKMSRLRSVTLKNNPVCCHCSSYKGRNLTIVLELLKDLDNISCFDRNPRQSIVQSIDQIDTRTTAASMMFLLKNPTGVEVSLAVALLLLTFCAIILTFSSAFVHYRGATICKLSTRPQNQPKRENPPGKDSHLLDTGGCSLIGPHRNYSETFDQSSSMPIFSNFLSGQKSFHEISKPFRSRLSSKLRKKSRLGLDVSFSHEQLISMENRNSPTSGQKSRFKVVQITQDTMDRVSHQRSATSGHGVPIELPAPSTSSPIPSSSSSSSSSPSSASASSSSSSVSSSTSYFLAVALPEVAVGAASSESRAEGSDVRSTGENVSSRSREVPRAINSHMGGAINNDVASEQRTLAKQFLAGNVFERF